MVYSILRHELRRLLDSLEHAPEYCFTMQSCLTLKPSLVAFVHHCSSLPCWLYSLPAESKACYKTDEA